MVAMAEPHSLVIANWKMHGSRALVQAMLDELLREPQLWSRVEAVFCPPFVFLDQVRQRLRHSTIAWGAQDLSALNGGARTGEVSASMLVDQGCRYVIVGHSERRLQHREDDELIAQKVARALEADMVPVLCVGEDQAERARGLTMEVVERQLQPVLGADAPVVVAYEPVWAVGGSRPATPGEALPVHQHIRSLVQARGGSSHALRVLYGGSVSVDNVEQLRDSGADGFLLGRSSLDAAPFMGLCRKLEELCSISS